MRLIMIRHGDPDYVNDTVTEKGRKEAELLSERLLKIKADKIYVSHLGRAMDTAKPYLEKSGQNAVVLDWLEEFHCRVWRPDDEEKEHVAWDWLPQDWTVDGRFYSLDEWGKNDRFVAGKVREKYDEIVTKFDELLAVHGYVRKNNLYLAKRPNRDTILFFCHFGLECVLMSRLFNIPPMPLWHGLCCAPTGVSEIVTEERREGYASFRMLTFGDVSHLTQGGEEVSFQARFCETFDSITERHD